MVGRLLVAYSNASNHVSTTAEYLQSLAVHSKFDIHYVHVTNGAVLDFDIDDFDAIFQSYCVRHPIDDYVSIDYLHKLKAFKGVKLLAAQDEYDNTNKLRSAIREIGYHAMLTNVPQAMLSKIYPRHQFPGTEFITVLTGYVPEHLKRRSIGARPLSERPIYIGYRGRELPAYYGKLGYEKYEIGRRMREICIKRGMTHDIEWTDNKRIYGSAWYDFLGACRACLGAESGSNVFDFTGTIRATYETLSAARGAPVPYDEFRLYTDPVEAEYDMGQVSPRIFEAAMLRTPMILFSGSYSGIIEPGEHYLELKKDFSNADAVLDALDDLDALEKMADRAYARLVGSGRFAYRQLVELIDETIERKVRELGVTLRPPLDNPAFQGIETAASADLRERPTREPHHPLVFSYKQLSQQYQRLKEDATQYNAQIESLCETVSELVSVEKCYAAEIGRLNEVVAILERNATLEFEAYSAQATRLNSIISDLQHRSATDAAELARLNEIIDALQEQAARLPERATKRWLAALHHRLGRTPRLRRIARTAAAPLPAVLRIRSRIRSGLVLMLHRH